MLFRYPAALALTLAAAFALSPAAPAATGPHHPHRRQAARAAVNPPSAAALYSAKALRRTRIILQLKMLELRAERLERVRKALERNLPVNRLIDIP